MSDKPKRQRYQTIWEYQFGSYKVILREELDGLVKDDVTRSVAVEKLIEALYDKFIRANPKGTR